MNFISIFFTGLLTGGLTCMAVQGGLLATTIAKRKEGSVKGEEASAFPLIAFLVAKLVAYTVLGFFLGWLGSFFKLSLTVSVILQIAVGIFMIGTALNLLNVHPIFRYFAVSPPRFLTRLVRKQSKSHNIFAPAVLGGFTVFIPCGTTQAMMALAIASANPLLGALVLFVFTIGTSPVFFILGYFATKLGGMLQDKFSKVAAASIILIALFNLNNALALTGSPFTLEKVIKNVYCTVSFCSSSVLALESLTNPTISFSSSGYTPNVVAVKAGSKISLNLVNQEGYGCVQSFTIPSLGIQKVIPVGSSDVVEFTAPQSGKEIDFMCGMGMYRGRIRAI